MNPNFLPPEFVLPLDWDNSRQIIVDRETRTADAINATASGYYSTIELQSGHQFFSTNNPKLGFRKLVDLGALPNAGTKLVPHGITGIVQLTHLYGSATGVNSYLPLPYFSLTSGIELQMDVTNIIITTATDKTAYSGIAVIEYLKN